MAKKEKLSLEELLEQALVKDEPHEVPENWLYFYFTSLIDIQGGTQPPKSHFVSEPKDGYVRLVQIRDFSSDDYKVYIPAKNNLRYFEENDILIARYGASIGRICSGLSGACNVALAKTTFSPKVFNRKFIYWLLNSEYFQRPLQFISRTAQAGFNKEDLSKFAMPLPPLPEQQRIAALIESLFEKLDRAKELAQNALDSFENRKSAILYKAFTGELTKKWREENGVGMDSWDTVLSNEIFEYVTSGSRGWAQYYSLSGDIFLRMGNLDHNTIELDLSELQYVSLPSNVEGIRSKVKKNDILISITADVGMVGFVRECDVDTYINQHVALARPIMNVCAEYIAWYLVSDHGLLQLKSMQRGATKIGLGLSDIRSLQIKIPSIDEQQKIVSIIRDLVGKEDKAKELCVLEEKIDHIKKSILAKAFRGKLDTNHPEEESALELLKEVLREQSK